MELKTPTIIFDRDLAKGFIPKTIEQHRKEEALILIKYLLRIENGVENMPQAIQDSILEKQLNYSDMFVLRTLQDQKKNNTIHFYPTGLFRPYDENFEKTVLIGDDSDLCCYKDIFVTLSIYEFESIPRMGFETASTYVIFMLAMYNSDYTGLESLVETNEHEIDRVKSFETAVANFSDETGILVEFLLHRVLSLLVLQKPEFKSQLIQTAGSKIVSNVTFPPKFLSARGENFYGKLLMRLREAIL
jgi:hypothetical protein